MRCAVAALAAALVLAGPAAGGPHTEGGYDPALMSAWASSVASLDRGPVDINDPDPETPDAGFGDPGNALGPSVASNLHVVSLGDAGQMTLYFASGIRDGPGDDFAVYENGFWPSQEGMFAEFAYVEVSSDGQAFARFPSECLHDDPVPVTNADVVDPSDYHNLGGKHVLGSGTGFDLAELAGHPLVLATALDLQDVRFVRLVDVIGDGSTLDASENPIWDPHPTPFDNGGFDVEAVGVLHPVPEPGALAGLAAGVAALSGLARRRSAAPCGRGG